MNWFKEKCSHLYEEIGKCYDRIDYGNGTHINAYIVKKCKICGNITAKTVYSNEFTRYTSPVRVDDCVKKLIDMLTRLISFWNTKMIIYRGNKWRSIE